MSYKIQTEEVLEDELVTRSLEHSFTEDAELESQPDVTTDEKPLSSVDI